MSSSRVASLVACLLVCAGTASAQSGIFNGVRYRDQQQFSPAICGTQLNGGDVTLTLTGVVEGDLVVLYGGRGNSNDAQAFGPITSGYTAAATIDSTGPKLGLWYKLQGATPDTSVVGEGGGGAAHGVAYCAYVLMAGTFDPVALFDTALVSTGQVTAVPNCPAITHPTDNALVVCHSGNSVNDTTPGSTDTTQCCFVSGLGGTVVTTNDTDDLTIDLAGAQADTWAAGTHDPTAWSTWSSGIGGSFTVAWKPIAKPCHRALLGVGC